MNLHITNDAFPLFVLLPDEGTFRVVMNMADLGWHEELDLETETHYAWNDKGQRFRLGMDTTGAYFLERAESDELLMCWIICNWSLWWYRQKRLKPRYLGDYSILQQWNDRIYRIISKSS